MKRGAMLCYRCKKPGHSKSECPERGRRHSHRVGACHFCGTVGHRKAECPSIGANSGSGSGTVAQASKRHATCSTCGGAWHDSQLECPTFQDTRDYFFLIDCSGSMACALPHVAKGLLEATEAMGDFDRLGVVVFGNGVNFKLKPRSLKQLRRQEELPALFKGLFAGGLTPLYDAMFSVVDQRTLEKAGRRGATFFVVTDGANNNSTHTAQDVAEFLGGEEGERVRLHFLRVNGSYALEEYQGLCRPSDTYDTVASRTVGDRVVELIHA